MEVTDVGQAGMLETGADQDGQNMVIPIVVQVMEVAEHQRGVKRTRRDRGSTAKDRISKMPPCAAGKRSSIYRGVTRHRWTGRYEAHLWDKCTWNQSQNKKGKQVYLGAYDEEEAAARAYDLAALKYWGPGTLINFPLADYARDIEEMQNVTREEYLASLRRKSSGFSRGVSKYRGVARHHHNGRWEARIGRVFGNKYLYLGTYSTQEEAAAAYDMAAIEYRGLNAVTNFDLSRYIRWLRPEQGNPAVQETDSTLSPKAGTRGDDSQLTESTEEHYAGQEEHPQHAMWPAQSTKPYQLPSLGLAPSNSQQRSSSSPTALSLLLQSSMFKQMMERACAAAPPECDSISTNRDSEVSHGIKQQQHHHDNSAYYSSWEIPTSHRKQAPPLVEDEVSPHHGHDNRASYHQSDTSNHHRVVSDHYADLQDHKQQQQHYGKVHHRQQQPDHLLVAHGLGYPHSVVSTLYNEDSCASPPSEDRSWGFTSVLPSCSAISTC